MQKLEFDLEDKKIELVKWINLQKNKYHEICKRPHEEFALGILHESDVFDFKLGEILFTRRDFGKFPTK